MNQGTTSHESRDIIKRILRQAGISREDWEKA